MRLSWATARYFALASGGALFKISQRQKPPDDHQLIASIPSWPGTLVAVDVGLDWELDFADFIEATRASFTKRSEEATERAERLLTFE